MLRIVLATLVAVGLSGCVAATIPLNAAAGAAISDRAISRTEGITQLNCAQLRERWAEASSPGAFLNPTRLVAAERSLIRTTAQHRGCPVS